MKIGLINSDGSLLVDDISNLFPDTSFPEEGPNQDFIDQNNLKSIVTTIPFDGSKEQLVFCDPYLYDDKICIVRKEPIPEIVIDPVPADLIQ